VLFPEGVFVRRRNTMSVAGIASNLFDYAAQGLHHNRQQFQQEFKALGQDLKSGDLSAAQSDFAMIQQLNPYSNASSYGTNPIAQAFNQLSTDLKSGNLSAARQDYSNMEQHFESRAVHHHHVEAGGNDTIDQLMQQLGQALQAGNLSAAQKSYSTLQQDLQQFAQQHGLSATEGTSPTGGVSVSA
jgi:outer membrane protein assembly factor BamD (BamD/ComL family)